MSTYYFMLCPGCSEVTDAVSRTAGGYCHLGDSSDTLLPFIIAHSGCGEMRILSEYEWFDYDTEMYIKWNEKNVKTLIDKAINEGRWLG